MIKFLFSVKTWLRIVIGLLYLGLVALLSLLPNSRLPNIPFITGQDKVVHITMYLGMAFLACWSVNLRDRRQPSTFLMLAGVFAWGVLMEILQHLMGIGRGMEYLDMLANLVGATAGLLGYLYVNRLRNLAIRRIEE